VEVTILHEVAHGAQDSAGFFRDYPSLGARGLSASCAAGASFRYLHPDLGDAETTAALTAARVTEPDAVAAFNAGFTGMTKPRACLSGYMR
jgi:hypothetical protein